MASVSINHPEYARAIFRRVGQVFMDESEDRTVRQFAGQVLLDFRRTEYRMALLKFAREEVAIKQNDAWYPLGFDAEDVEIAFHQSEPELWYYTEDWMRFYEPPEIQRRQKRWARDRLGRVKLNDRPPGGRGEGRVLNFDPDPGRLRPNDPCPCGSGKKYKNCCLPVDRSNPPEPPEGLD
ncbi:MAG: SEC-C domain-containing protein [Proteobacteria bacterium]|nr:SEC-C domain-containing protein [Pseudomonadota bacterium]MBU1741998.1 SEC-C domain-containing protein [Pseudomonadota bacterium]